MVRLGRVASEALGSYLTWRLRFGGKQLWITEDGKPLIKTGLLSTIRCLKRFGGNVRCSPHTFRNTFALAYLRAIFDPFTLQILGGCEDLEMPRYNTAALKAEDAFRVHMKASPADALMSAIETSDLK